MGNEFVDETGKNWKKDWVQPTESEIQKLDAMISKKMRDTFGIDAGRMRVVRHFVKSGKRTGETETIFL